VWGVQPSRRWSLTTRPRRCGRLRSNALRARFDVFELGGLYTVPRTAALRPRQPGDDAVIESLIERRTADRSGRAAQRLPLSWRGEDERSA
jgi:hypothetical protein